MNKYTISRVPDPTSPADDGLGGTTVVSAVLADTPQRALQLSICGRAVAAAAPHDQEAGHVYADLFHDADWYFVNNDDRLHDFGLFKIVGRCAVSVR